jgi:hypothetical protein
MVAVGRRRVSFCAAVNVPAVGTGSKTRVIRLYVPITIETTVMMTQFTYVTPAVQ